MEPLKLGKFRTPSQDETAAAYFRAATFKLAKASKDFDETSVHRFVNTVIGRAKSFQDFIDAYFHAKGRFEADGPLHLCADDLLKKAA